MGKGSSCSGIDYLNWQLPASPISLPQPFHETKLLRFYLWRICVRWFPPLPSYRKETWCRDSSSCCLGYWLLAEVASLLCFQLYFFNSICGYLMLTLKLLLNTENLLCKGLAIGSLSDGAIFFSQELVHCCYISPWGFSGYKVPALIYQWTSRPFTNW